MTVLTNALTRRLLADDAQPLTGALSREALIGLLREAGLTGRGGAGFPVWRKLAAVAGAPVVIGNGSEGEPASAKDRVLLTYRPDLVLDGLRLVADALGARESHLYLPADLMPRLAAHRRGVILTAAPERFVAGEASAVANAVAGRAAVPSDRTERLAQRGIVVQNVETLAHIALIARHGPAWFREAGTADEPGTFLATVGGAVARPGVLEAGYGVTLAELVDGAGGATATIQAVLVGGYHGAWVPARPDLPVSRAALAPYDASPGAGVVHVLPADACGLAETARIAGYLAGQVAGQCGPCVNGLPRLADALLRLVHGEPDIEEVARLARSVEGRGACNHPDGTVRLIRSSLRTFAADVDAHLAGHCRANGAPR